MFFTERAKVIFKEKKSSCKSDKNGAGEVNWRRRDVWRSDHRLQQEATGPADRRSTLNCSSQTVFLFDNWSFEEKPEVERMFLFLGNGLLNLF